MFDYTVIIAYDCFNHLKCEPLSAIKRYFNSICIDINDVQSLDNIKIKRPGLNHYKNIKAYAVTSTMARNPQNLAGLIYSELVVKEVIDKKTVIKGSLSVIIDNTDLEDVLALIPYLQKEQIASKKTSLNSKDTSPFCLLLNCFNVGLN